MAFTLRPAAPLAGASVLPDPLIAQYVKPASAADALLVNALRDTAITWVENRSTTGLTSRVWRATFDGIEPVLWLGRSPVTLITSVAYAGANGLPVLLVGPWSIGEDGMLRTDGWPPASAGPVMVTFTAGYTDIAQAPPALIVASLLMLRHLYDGDAADDAPATVTMLCDQDRTPVVAS